MSTHSNFKTMTWLLLIVGWFAVSANAASAQSAQEEYALAAGHYDRSNWAQSVVQFRSLVRNHPDSKEAASAEFFLAEVMMQQGKFEQAYRAFQIFHQRLPQHEYAGRATFRMGEAAYRTGKYEVALRVLEEFVKKNSHHELAEFALPYLGEMRLMRDEPQLAQRAFETALRIYPGSQISNNCRLGLAKSLQAQGQEADAIRFYEFLMTQANDDLFGESHLQMGIMSFTHVDYQKAERHLTAALNYCESKQSQSEATYWLARTHNELEDYDRAIALLKTIADENLPENLHAAVLFDGAVSATKTKNDLLALRWLARLREKYPNNALADESFRMAIDIHQRRDDSDKALVLIRQFRKKHKRSPLRSGILESEGRTHYAAKRYQETIETFDTLLEENSGDAQSDPAERANWYYLKSLGHLGLKEFEAADESLGHLDSLAQSNQLKPLVQIALATARFGMGHYKEAAGNYRKYLETSPHGAEQKRARADLTICLGELNQWDKAAAAFEDLSKFHEDDPIVLATVKFLAERSFQQEELEHAERWFNVMARPGNPQELVARGLSGLAWIKMESQDTPSAHAVFERLLAECPDSKFAGEAAVARAKYLENKQDYESAAETYAMVIRRFGTSPVVNVAKLRRAYALQKIGGELNLEESKTLLIEYLALPGDHPLTDEALYQLAWVLNDLGETAACRLRFAELVDAHSSSKYWSDAAYRLIQHDVANHDFVATKPLIKELLTRTDAPQEVVSRVLFLKGQMAASENQWELVTATMRELSSRSVDTITAVKADYWLAESLYRQKEYTEAVEIFSGLIPRMSSIDPKLEPWVWLRASQCHGNENDWKTAAELANEAKRKFPDFESDYEFDFVLGRASEDQGKLSDARAAYQRVVDSPAGGSTETAAIAQWRIGETFFHQEEFVDAIKAYHKVDSLFAYTHWRSAALIQAGKCQEHLKHNKHAIKLYTQLIDSFPETEFAADAKKRRKRLIELAKPIGQAKLGKPSEPDTNRR